MKSPTEKKKYESSYFYTYSTDQISRSYLLTVLDLMQSVTHGRKDAHTHGQDQTNMPPQLLLSWGHKKEHQTPLKLEMDLSS